MAINPMDENVFHDLEQLVRQAGRLSDDLDKWDTAATQAEGYTQRVHDLPVDEITLRLHGLGHYSDVQLFNRGGMGLVFVAANQKLHRKEILKVVPRASGETHDRSLEEAKVLGRVGGHPNVVQVFDVLDNLLDDAVVLVMEFVPGHDLERMISLRGPFSEFEATEIVLQAAKALEYFHLESIVHRDLKPANMILTKAEGAEGYLVKILDFGISKSEVRQSGFQTSSDFRLGTRGYMSEQQFADSSKHDIRNDIYSLGCTYFHLINGHLPSERSTRNDCRIANSIIDKMLAEPLEDRFQRPADLIEALVAAKSKLAPFATSDLFPVETNRLSRLQFVLVMAGTAVLVPAAWYLSSNNANADAPSVAEVERWLATVEKAQPPLNLEQRNAAKELMKLEDSSSALVGQEALNGHRKCLQAYASELRTITGELTESQVAHAGWLAESESMDWVKLGNEALSGHRMAGKIEFFLADIRYELSRLETQNVKLTAKWGDLSELKEIILQFKNRVMRATDLPNDFREALIDCSNDATEGIELIEFYLKFIPDPNKLDWSASVHVMTEMAQWAITLGGSVQAKLDRLNRFEQKIKQSISAVEKSALRHGVKTILESGALPKVASVSPFSQASRQGVSQGSYLLSINGERLFRRDPRRLLQQSETERRLVFVTPDGFRTIDLAAGTVAGFKPDLSGCEVPVIAQMVDKWLASGFYLNLFSISHDLASVTVEFSDGKQSKSIHLETLKKLDIIAIDPWQVEWILQETDRITIRSPGFVDRVLNANHLIRK